MDMMLAPDWGTEAERQRGTEAERQRGREAVQRERETGSQKISSPE